MSRRDIGRQVIAPEGVVKGDLELMGKDEASKRLGDFLSTNRISDPAQKGLRQLLAEAATHRGLNVRVEVGTSPLADEVHTALQMVTDDEVATGLAAVVNGLELTAVFEHGEAGGCFVCCKVPVSATDGAQGAGGGG